jgi:CubicO group peptidase (beta-lactamase class C family)
MEKLEKFVEEQLQVWEVPGCAVSAVKDGEIVLNKGFGLRDVKADEPVTADTLFPIGSTTKAFTSSSVGALVDDGLVEWETPVREYIPNFRLHDPVATERVTPRDLLAHVTGLPRHEFVWIGHPKLSRAELVSRLRYLPPSKDIRQTWQYCNLTYMTAGYLVEVVSGMTWEEYARTRLLKPLGMERTNFSIDDSEGSGDYAKPYEKRKGEVVEIPFRRIDHVGPAGSMNSSSGDFASWIRMNLARSEDATDQILSPATLEYIQSPQAILPDVPVFPEISANAYGLGWVVGRYRGRKHVHHSGGIDGFYTECMLLPEEGIGVAVVSNRLVTLGQVIAHRVLDELLEEEPIDWSGRIKERMDAMEKGGQEARAAAPKVENAPPLRELSEYAGEYSHPGYGTFKISLDEDRLVPEFGTGEFTLTHRHFDVFDLEWHELSGDTVFHLTFQTGVAGDVVGLTIPFEPSLEPIRFDRLPDKADPETLKKLTGIYAMGPIELKVELKSDTILTIGLSGMPSAELVPQRGLRFSIKENPTQTVEFVLTGDAVDKIVVQPGGVFTPKTDEAAEELNPS